MTTIKENRIVNEVTVPHSPVACLDICYEVFDTSAYRVWIKGHPEHWDTGTSLREAIGSLICGMTELCTVERGSYHGDKRDRNPLTF